MSRGLMIIFTIIGQGIPGTEVMMGTRNVFVIIAGQTGVITGTVMIIAMTAATIMVREDVVMGMDMAGGIGNLTGFSNYLSVKP